MHRHDGINMWDHLSTNWPSNRTEIVHNIDPLANASSIRYGDHKLVQGIFANAMLDERYQLSGGPRPYRDLDILASRSKVAKVLKRFHGIEKFPVSHRWRQEATVNCGSEAGTNFVPVNPPYLFNIADDPCELNNLAASKPRVSRFCRVDAVEK